MDIAMRAIGPLLPKLGELLVGEFTLEKRMRKGIESLLTELTLMHAALRKVAKVPPDQLDEGVKIWAGNIKELSYQMEDIVDAFMVRVECHAKPANPKNKVKKLLKKTIRLFKKGRDLHHLSDALDEAVGQAKQLAELRQRYEQETRDTADGSSIDPRMLALYTDVTELVGIEEARDKLINMLTKGDDWSEQPMNTVSIVGFGGLGKTTLAKTAYDKIKVKFDCGAFVSVSQNPDMKKVFKNILYGLDKDKYENIHNAKWEEQHLIDELIEFLTDKRYIIVIDDIWDGKAWKLIQCAFSKKSPGSRLITTTRIISVSQACCSSSDDIYRMEPLSQDVSRRLFHKRVFSHEKGCPSELVQVSEDILHKCGGIPLAIITIASLLSSNFRIETKDQWYALLNSIGRGLTEDRSVEEMKKILLFSYYDLPSYLKPCLLYLSVFEEDEEILRGKLVCKWISEGFVYSEKQETNLHELGDSYFNELVNRSMIQPIGFDDEEKVEACRVHDMVLDLICSLSSEENFVTIFDGNERKMPQMQRKVRRLSIRCSKVDVDTTGMAHMRSLSFTSNIVDLVLNIASFQVIRVLDLEGCDISDVGYVADLLHLRYLGLKDTRVRHLPEEIGKLQFLQTLDIRGANIVHVPLSVVRLRHLMCLYVEENMELPPGIGSLTSLEVLVELGVGSLDSGNHLNFHFVKELGHLTKLRVLKLHLTELDESMSKVFLESLSNLHKLESLSIVLGHVDLMREGWVPPLRLRRLEFQYSLGPFLTLPTWISPSSLPVLSYLSINVYEVRPEDIQILGMLPALRYLNLSADSTGVVAAEMHAVTAGAYPCATECYFDCNTAVLPSIFARGAAPRLKHLGFEFRGEWISRGDIDLGTWHLPSLENVEAVLFTRGATGKEVMEARATVQAAADEHPNRPSLRLIEKSYSFF
uniref:Uncharacterized protein n=3 Tax=Avena sativa TaxID=4498 RepID=A0ACD5XFU8_AVESA